MGETEAERGREGKKGGRFTQGHSHQKPRKLQREWGRGERNEEVEDGGMLLTGLAYHR